MILTFPSVSFVRPRFLSAVCRFFLEGDIFDTVGLFLFSILFEL